MEGPDQPMSALADAMRRVLPPGSRRREVEHDDTLVVDVLARSDDVLVRFRWRDYPYDLGFALDPGSAYARFDGADDWAGQAVLMLDDVSGAPYVGHAVVVRLDADTALLEECVTTPGTPGSVALDLCRLAAHSASWHGARSVVTDLEHPALGILGFEDRDGRRVLDTRFLSVDHDAAARLVAAEPDWRPPRGRRGWGRSHIVSP